MNFTMSNKRLENAYEQYTKFIHTNSIIPYLPPLFSLGNVHPARLRKIGGEDHAVKQVQDSQKMSFGESKIPLEKPQSATNQTNSFETPVDLSTGEQVTTSVEKVCPRRDHSGQFNVCLKMSASQEDLNVSVQIKIGKNEDQ
jgi:hypothetical protein